MVRLMTWAKGMRQEGLAVSPATIKAAKKEVEVEPKKKKEAKLF